MNILKHLIAASLISLFYSLPSMAASMPGPGMMSNDNDRERYGQGWGGPGYGYGGMMGPGMMGQGYGYGGIMGPGMMGPGYGYGGGMMGPGMMGQGYGYDTMMPYMHGLGGLDLNDSQRKKLIDNMDAMHNKHWTYMEQLSEASIKLAQLYSESPLDAKKIRAAYETLFKVRLNMIDDMIKYRNEFEASLTEEQRKSLQQYNRGYPGQYMMR